MLYPDTLIAARGARKTTAYAMMDPTTRAPACVRASVVVVVRARYCFPDVAVVGIVPTTQVDIVSERCGAKAMAQYFSTLSNI